MNLIIYKVHKGFYKVSIRFMTVFVRNRSIHYYEICHCLVADSHRLRLVLLGLSG